MLVAQWIVERMPRQQRHYLWNVAKKPANNLYTQYRASPHLFTFGWFLVSPNTRPAGANIRDRINRAHSGSYWILHGHYLQRIIEVTPDAGGKLSGYTQFEVPSEFWSSKQFHVSRSKRCVRCLRSGLDTRLEPLELNGESSFLDHENCRHHHGSTNCSLSLRRWEFGNGVPGRSQQHPFFLDYLLIRHWSAHSFPWVSPPCQLDRW